MSDDRKKPLWPWIVALLIGLPVLYAASFGPACWIAVQTFDSDEELINGAYFPLLWVGLAGPEKLQYLLRDYARLGMPDGCRVSLFLEHDAEIGFIRLRKPR